MHAQLIVAVVVEPLDGCFLDRAVHPLDLAVGPWVVGLGQPVLDAVGLADHVEADWSGGDGGAVPGLFGELDPVACWERSAVDGYGRLRSPQRLRSRRP